MTESFRTMDLIANNGPDYEFVDAGDGRRLERFGPHVLDRPAPAALWGRERRDEWAQVDAMFERRREGGGRWKNRRKLPGSWRIAVDRLSLLIKPTGFGHIGFFPEHACHWDWCRERIKASPAPCRILHLFAYTGAMTLVAASAGAQLAHVEAVKDVNAWARDNARASGLQAASIRWLTDDAAKFVARELRRGNRYDAIVLDPPSYGRGPKGEKWVLERDLCSLLQQTLGLMTETPRFVLFTAHNPGFSPPLMANMLLPWQTRFGGAIEAGTMLLGNPACACVLPSGFYARWTPNTALGNAATKS